VIKVFDFAKRLFSAPMTPSVRTILAIPVAVAIFYLGAQKYKTNEIIMPIWKRNFDNLWHGITQLGHTGTVEASIPNGVVGMIAAVLTFFIAYKALALFPSKLNLHFVSLAVMDYFVVAVLVNIFIFSGTGFELIMYAGAFLAGALVFGNRLSGQISLLVLVGMIFLRFMYIDNLYPYLFFIPVLTLVYILLRAPFNSNMYLENLQRFSAKGLAREI
jgi:hypothetical protein